MRHARGLAPETSDSTTVLPAADQTSTFPSTFHTFRDRIFKLPIVVTIGSLREFTYVVVAEVFMRITGPGRVSGPPDRAITLSQTGERLDACLEDARGALSGHTVRALRADLDAFASWCAERDLSPLPARAETVAAYVDAMAGARAPATVRRYVFSLTVAHRAAGEQSPLEHAAVQRALQRMRRRNGSRQSQVQGLTWNLRRRLIGAAGDRPIDLRNRALLAVAYDAMLRRSELVALQVVDMTVDRRGSASLLVRRGKNDSGGGWGDALPPPRHREAGAGVARPERHRLGQAVPFGHEGRRRGRGARRKPGAAHLPRDGRARGPAFRHGAADLRAQPARGGGPGHDRLGDRDPRDHAGRALEERLDGAALRRAAARAAERRRAARTAAEAQVSAEGLTCSRFVTLSMRRCSR